MHRFLEDTADQYMTRVVTTVTRQTTIRELEALFEKHDFNSLPVVEDGKMLGIVTKFDFLRAFAFTTGQMVPHYDELMRRPLAEMMTEAVVHVEPAAPLTRVLQLMVSLKSRSFCFFFPGYDWVRSDCSPVLPPRTDKDNAALRHTSSCHPDKGLEHGWKYGGTCSKPSWGACAGF
jgi:CBS domain-containing protein